MYKGKKKKINISNIDTKIYLLKDEIQEKLRIYDTTVHSLCFSFYDAQLNQYMSFNDYKILENSIIRVNLIQNNYQIRISFGKHTSLDFNAFSSNTEVIRE